MGVTDNIKNQDRIAGVSLDSPGGNVREALLFAIGVKGTEVPTIVGPEEQCVSACFLIFAAGKKRFASEQAHIGVHSLVIKGEGENLDAKGSTLDLARIATEKLRVPPSIIGRMVATPPDKVYWLTRSDLAEMGVQIIDDKLPVQAPASAPEVSVKSTTSNKSAIRHNSDPEVRKALLPPSSSLCPPPYQMTPSDGCQK
jgi:hypothetical protein